MENITFDSGIRTFKINGNGVLRFNPADPNLYSRFFDAADKLREIEKELEEEGKNRREEPLNGETIIRLMTSADKKAKAILAEVFGRGNDFDQVFGGVNVLAVAENGERVITNFIEAIGPIIQAGAEGFANSQIAVAKKEADAMRAERTAGK